MKKCPYCAKDIGYDQLYCSKECEKMANDYYTKRAKVRTFMNVIYIGGTAALALGIFFYAMFNYLGLFLVAGGCTAMGIATILLPSPTEEMINKYKLKKAETALRFFGVFLLAIGLAALITAIIRLCL